MGVLKKSILFRASLAMATIISLAFAGIFSSVYIAQTSEGYAAAINQAGTLRMQSYRIASSLVHQADFHRLPSAFTTQQLVDEFEQRLYSGRIHKVLSTEAGNQVLNTYQVVETQWEILLKPNLNRFTKGGGKAALEQGDKTSEEEYRIYFLSRVDDFVDKIHLFVEALETEAEKKIELIRVIQVYVLALTLIVIIFNMQFIRKGVMQPLNELMKSAGAIKKGNFSVRVKINTEDELGQLGTAFNKMSENLLEMYSDLEQRVRSKTEDLELSNRSLELLYKVTKRLSESVVSAEVMDNIIQDIEEQLGVKGGAVCLGKPGDKKAYRMASSNELSAICGLEENESNCQYCLGEGDAHAFPIGTKNTPNHSIYSTPIMDKEDHYGVLLIRLEQNKQLEDWQQRLLDTIASHIGLALKMAQNMRQTRKLALSEERSIIARELHDSIAQSLSYLKIQVSRLGKEIANSTGEAKYMEINLGIRDGLNNAYRHLRELLTSFRLSVDESGLETALNDAVMEFSRRGNLAIELKFHSVNCQFSPNAEIHLNHIVREALSNIVQHSQASAASVELHCNQEGTARLLIEDNGIGLEKTQDESRHFGLSIMQERTQSIGGNIVFDEIASGGTRVQVDFKV